MREFAYEIWVERGSAICVCACQRVVESSGEFVVRGVVMIAFWQKAPIKEFLL